jgi:hypothetical protein
LPEVVGGGTEAAAAAAGLEGGADDADAAAAAVALGGGPWPAPVDDGREHMKSDITGSSSTIEEAPAWVEAGAVYITKHTTGQQHIGHVTAQVMSRCACSSRGTATQWQEHIGHVTARCALLSTWAVTQSV